jgi:cobalt-precorrin-5B (C1)-methyltransferase
MGSRRLGSRGGIAILAATGIVPPVSTATWLADVERSVSAMAARGEKTLVLCTGGRTGQGARRMMPKLPEACFVEVGDFTGAALRRAVEHGLTQVVFVGMADKLARLASGVLGSRADLGLLSELTRAVGGTDDLADQVAAAGTARRAYELWEADGLVGRAGRELCRQVAGAMEEFAGSGVAAQVVLVDQTGQRMIAMYGRLAR